MRSPYPDYIVPSNDLSGRILLCTLIASATVAFFWLYDVITHRDAPFVPSFAGRPEHAINQTAEAPVPDMASAAVRFSNADVASERTATTQPKNAEQAAIPKAVKPEKSLPAEAADAYASDMTYARPEYGAPE